jgi:DnaJ-class molecular chaperone
MQFQDYYQILGVERGASADEIKKRYRKLALEWHPDRHKGKTKAEAEKRFKEINEAYSVLSDPAQRGKYDSLGANWQHGQEFTGGATHGDSMSMDEFARRFGKNPAFSDFFSSIFGNGFGGGGEKARTFRRRTHKGADASAELELTISQVLAAGKQALEIPVQVQCDGCDGAGEDDSGRPCLQCGGLGSTRSARRIEVAIPRPLKVGAKLRLKGLGDSSALGGEAGDLYLTLHYVSDATYRVDELDVYADVPLAPWEALSGAKVEVRTPDGNVVVAIPPGTKAGARLRLRGRGIAGDGAERGDFYVVVRYQLPEDFSDAQKQALLELGRHAGAVRGGARS